MSLTFTHENHVQTFMYVKEIGDLVALYRKDGVQYLVSWAAYDEKAQLDIYVAAVVDQQVVEAYLNKNITGHDIQKQSSQLYCGTYTGQTLVAFPTSFATVLSNGYEMAVSTSYYNENLT